MTAINNNNNKKIDDIKIRKLTSVNPHKKKIIVFTRNASLPYIITIITIYLSTVSPEEKDDFAPVHGGCCLRAPHLNSTKKRFPSIQTAKASDTGKKRKIQERERVLMRGQLPRGEFFPIIRMHRVLAPTLSIFPPISICR